MGKKKTFYIYHIPDVKIGCSTNPKKRVAAQGYKNTNWEILEESDDIDIISKREKQLQKEYGYKVDKVDFKHSYNMQLKLTTKQRRKWAKDWCEKNPEKLRLGGKKLGLKNAKSGHIQKVGVKGRREGLKKLNEIKNNRINTLLDELPNQPFTGDKLKQVCKKYHKKLNVSVNYWQSLVKQNYIVLIKIGNQYQDSIYKKVSDVQRKNKCKNNQKDIRIKEILKLLPNKQFSVKQLKDACEKYGRHRHYYRKVAESKFVKTVHKGTNQFDPSIYEKVY